MLCDLLCSQLLPSARSSLQPSAETAFLLRRETTQSILLQILVAGSAFSPEPQARPIHLRTKLEEFHPPRSKRYPLPFSQSAKATVQTIPNRVFPHTLHCANRLRAADSQGKANPRG